MLIPIRHENMSARRWPVITLGLIAINIIVFLATFFTAPDDQQQQANRQVRAHLLMLAAMHTELTLSPQTQELVKSFQEQNPKMWAYLQDANRPVADGWDAKVRLMSDEDALQAEMDTLEKQYAEIVANPSVVDEYAFVPAHPRPITYLTANFLHGGWLHLIGNLWFLWLAGFVLEDLWGRPLYSIFYLVAGAAALQVHALTNAGSTVPALGASGAVAGLMGAFLVRFPKMKIEMRWILGIRSLLRGGYQFSAPAWTLLPLWLLTEIFYGSLVGHASGVAHWAHVGGFVFGALIALAFRFTGLEHLANKAVEEKVSWVVDPEIQQATELMEKGQNDEAIALLRNLLAAKPESVDACSLLQQISWRKGDVPAYHELTAQLCALHLKTRENDLAWQNYEEFLSTGGENMPAGTWLDLCRVAESKQDFERAVAEYQKVAAAYPSDKRSLQAMIAAGRICSKQLNRPDD
ncbi:MAG TPA: rhomboid family intramembrane serine protease, partial [Candidatus Angelobacter sp.]|nr:rhomboid family intramembrane serine protease [Candidatus Angelobacter sp.]